MLLEDCPQKRSFAYLRGNVRKGELVQIDKANQWMVAFSNPPVLIDCHMNQLKIVRSRFVQYLVAVENLASRFNLFTNNFNSFAKNILLNVGDRVDVTIDQHTVPVAAIVRYKGSLPGKKGIKFGIEILDDDKFGDTDGTFYHERKFSCPPNKGLFVSIDKLIKLSSAFMLEYNKQCADGVAASRSFKITFVGPEGSGKSSTIRTLLGKKFNPNELSTIGAVLGIQAVINWFKGTKTTIEDKEVFNLQSCNVIGWKEASINDMQKVLDREFNKEMCSKLVPPKNPVTTKLLHTEAILDIIENIENDKSAYGFEEPDNISTETNVTDTDFEQYSQAKNVVYGEKVDKLDAHACISDFAGQYTYFSFQLFFLKKRDTVIITFNASLKLTAKIIPRERYDHARKKRVAAGMMTIIENIEFWLQSISAHAGTDDVPKGCISRRSPTAILCGTHAEKLSAEEMVTISEFIFKSLEGKLYAGHLPVDDKKTIDRTKAIVFISNKKRGKFKDKINDLQKVLLEASSPAYFEERPISYLRLEKLIAVKVEEGNYMINVEEFTKLVNKAGIPGESNSEAVTAALQYSSTRGTILHFPEVEVLSKIVFVSPDWLSSVFSKIITTHDQIVNSHPLHRAWKRYDTFAILEEQFLDHILKEASVSDPEHKVIIISLMELFNLLAKIPNDTCLADESAPPPCDGRAYIVPSLLLYNGDLSVFIPQNADQIYLFYFSELYFPESVFNQVLVKMIKWSVKKQYIISRIQHGLCEFNVDSLHSYCFIYEPNNYTLKVCITQLDKDITKEAKRRAFILFTEMMLYVEQSIHSVIELYLPSTKPPILHVYCPQCGDANPHIMLGRTTNVSLTMKQLFCTKTVPQFKLPRHYYLPFGDEVDDIKQSEQFHKSAKQISESAVLQQFYKDLHSGISFDELLPQLITKRIITIDDKIIIAESGRDVNERCQYFLDQYISKPLSAGDSSAFYKFLQVIDESSKYSLLAAKIKQSLMIESLQEKISDLNLSDTVQKQLPELDALVTFYEKICVSLPTDELLPKLVAERVIAITDKSRIIDTGKTAFERTQYLLDHHIAKPLSVGDPRFFNVLLDLMSTTPKCDFLGSEIQQYLSTSLKHQKFSDSCSSAPIENSTKSMNTL